MKTLLATIGCLLVLGGAALLLNPRPGSALPAKPAADPHYQRHARAAFAAGGNKATSFAMVVLGVGAVVVALSLSKRIAVAAIDDAAKARNRPAATDPTRT